MEDNKEKFTYIPPKDGKRELRSAPPFGSGLDKMKVKCSECNKEVDYDIFEEMPWDCHHSWCSFYGVCPECKAKLNKGEDHKKPCKYIKCTCGQANEDYGSHHDMSCPKYVEAIYPSCDICGMRSDDPNGKHLLWCPRYSGSLTYDTCVLCGTKNGHSSSCIYKTHKMPASDKMCTRNELYNFIYKVSDKNVTPSLKEKCDKSKNWINPKSTENLPDHIDFNTSGIKNLPENKLFSIDKLTYTLSTINYLIHFTTDSTRPDIKSDIGVKSFMVYYTIEPKWETNIPIPEEEILIELSCMFYGKKNKKLLMNIFRRRISPRTHPKGEILCLAVESSAIVLPDSAFSENWLTVKINQSEAHKIGTVVKNYNKQYLLLGQLTYDPDSSKPDWGEVIRRKVTVNIAFSFVKNSGFYDIYAQVDNTVPRQLYEEFSTYSLKVKGYYKSKDNWDYGIRWDIDGNQNTTNFNSFNKFVTSVPAYDYENGNIKLIEIYALEVSFGEYSGDRGTPIQYKDKDGNTIIVEIVNNFSSQGSDVQWTGPVNP